MASRKKSEIWNHFDFDVDEGKNKAKAKCNYCSVFINVSKGSTGNMTRHMRTKHVGMAVLLFMLSRIKLTSYWYLYFRNSD